MEKYFLQSATSESLLQQLNDLSCHFSNHYMAALWQMWNSCMLSKSPANLNPLQKALTQQMRSQPLNKDQQELGSKLPDPQLLFISSPRSLSAPQYQPAAPIIADSKITVLKPLVKQVISCFIISTWSEVCYVADWVKLKLLVLSQSQKAVLSKERRTNRSELGVCAAFLPSPEDSSADTLDVVCIRFWKIYWHEVNECKKISIM